jgi:hypothetical protein
LVEFKASGVQQRLGVPRLSIFRAAPIANWQQEAGLPKTAFASNGITALGLALQLLFAFDVSVLCGRLMGAPPE